MLHRQSCELKVNRTRHLCRFKRWPASQGVSLPIHSEFLGKVESIHLWDGLRHPVACVLDWDESTPVGAPYQDNTGEGVDVSASKAEQEARLMPKRILGAGPRRLAALSTDFVKGTEPDRLALSFVASDGSISSGTHMVLPAGQVGTWEIRTTVAEHAVRAGGGFLFQKGGFRLAYSTRGPNPQGRDYVTLQVETSSARVSMIVNNLDVYDGDSFVQIVVEEGQLHPGDSLTLRIGDRRLGGLGSEVPDATTIARFIVAVDRNGDGAFRELEASPLRVRVTSDPRADMLRVLGPSIVAANESFGLNFVVLDKYRNVCEQFVGEIAISFPDPVQGVPEALRFKREDKGIRVVEGACIATPGIYRIKSTLDGLQGSSNPIICEMEPKCRLFWGDLHCHTWGNFERWRLLDEPSFKNSALARHDQARRVGRLDFCAPGPVVPPNQEECPELWRSLQDAYKENDERGSYVPFLAYEAHPKGDSPSGDRNVVFREWSDGYLPSHSSSQELFKRYGGCDDVLLETHVGGTPPDWDSFPTREERLLEIASGHGCFEWLLQEALSRGYKPAVIGAGDTHLCVVGGPRAAHLCWGRFGRRLNTRDAGPGVGPLAAVWSESCERDALWQAIAERRTFATTGARIILDMQVNDRPGGSEISCDTPPVRIHIKVHACAPVQRLDLIRGDRCLRSWHSLNMDFDVALEDERPLRQTAYYVRLRQCDGEYAWSTPVWVSCRQGAESLEERLPFWNAQEPVDYSKLQPSEAEKYRAELVRYLEIEEEPEVFSEIRPAGIVHETPGDAALFYAFMEPEHQPVSIRLYTGFELPRIHLDFGWRDFGTKSR